MGLVNRAEELVASGSNVLGLCIVGVGIRGVAGHVNVVVPVVVAIFFGVDFATQVGRVDAPKSAWLDIESLDKFDD
jgi:hypothetical protein